MDTTMILRLRMELELDTALHSMRVINQKVVDGMPTTQVAENLTGVCGWAPCSKPLSIGPNGRLPKFCGRACYGKSRRNPNFIDHKPRRTPVVDAVTGVIRQPLLASAGCPSNQFITTTVEGPPPPSAGVYHSFQFPQL